MKEKGGERAREREREREREEETLHDVQEDHTCNSSQLPGCWDNETENVLYHHTCNRLVLHSQLLLEVTCNRLSSVRSLEREKRRRRKSLRLWQ
jgi:hypothetical protein